MGLTIDKIKQAVSDLGTDGVISETITFAFGTESEANIIGDYVESGGVFVWIGPLTATFNRETNFNITYTVGILWAKLTDLDSIQEDSKTLFETLEGYALQHVTKLQGNLRSDGLIGPQQGIQVGSYSMDRFNQFDGNMDGLFISFEVQTNKKVAC